MKPSDNFDLRKFITEGKLLKENTEQDILYFTFEEAKGKTVLLKLNEDGDTNTEFMKIDTLNDYQDLESVVLEYEEQGILDEYFIYQD